MTQYEKLVKLKSRIADLSGAASLLGWDQETYMPKKGGAFRARQLSTLEGLAHEYFTSNEMEQTLHTLSSDSDLSTKQKKNVEITKKDFDKLKKIPNEFVIKQRNQISVCFEKWIEAREKNDFAIYAVELKKLVAFKREEAALLDSSKHPYDTLLEQYEEENTIERLDILFAGVRTRLKPLLDKIKNAEKPNTDFLKVEYKKDAQWAFGIALLNKLGFDFNRGRQDIVVHPFCTSLSPDDTRITTHVNEHNMPSMVWSTIHECGHALYEQGLPSKEYGMPLGQAISLSVHESQSRLWENNICRSLGFWEANWPLVLAHFNDQLQTVKVTDFYKAINTVTPSLVRIEADELTYHFHIMIRYEIEKALIGGEIETEDIPALWNKKYKQYLDIDVPDDLKGCLQDVHWSHGLFGYFPTYSQGSFMAAQWLAFALKQVHSLKNDLEIGNAENLLLWLRENIHQHGKLYTSKQLCEKVTGEPLNFDYFMEYVEAKYSTIYNL